MTIYGAVEIIVAPIGGWLTDIFNYKKIYLSALLLNSIFCFTFAIKPTYQIALIIWVGFAISTSMCSYSAHIKMVRSLVPDE